MPRAIDNERRARVITACLEEGVPACQAAKRFGVSTSTATKWVAKARRGQLTAIPQGRPRGSRLDGHEAVIARLLNDAPHLTVGEMVQQLRERAQINVSYRCLYAWLRGRGWRPGQGLQTKHLAGPRAVTLPQHEDAADEDELVLAA